MSSRFTDGRLGVDTKHMGGGWGWGDARLLRRRPPVRHGSWWRRGTSPRSLLRFRFQIYSHMFTAWVWLSPCPQQVKRRLVFPAGIWARWGHLLAALNQLREAGNDTFYHPLMDTQHGSGCSLRNNPSTGLLLTTHFMKIFKPPSHIFPLTNFYSTEIHLIMKSVCVKYISAESLLLDQALNLKQT